MRHTTTVTSRGVPIHIIHNEDWSGETVLSWDDRRGIAIPEPIIAGIRADLVAEVRTLKRAIERLEP